MSDRWSMKKSKKPMPVMVAVLTILLIVVILTLILTSPAAVAYEQSKFVEVVYSGVVYGDPEDNVVLVGEKVIPEVIIKDTSNGFVNKSNITLSTAFTNPTWTVKVRADDGTLVDYVNSADYYTIELNASSFQTATITLTAYAPSVSMSSSRTLIRVRQEIGKTVYEVAKMAETVTTAKIETARKAVEDSEAMIELAEDEINRSTELGIDSKDADNALKTSRDFHKNAADFYESGKPELSANSANSSLDFSQEAYRLANTSIRDHIVREEQCALIANCVCVIAAIAVVLVIAYVLKNRSLDKLG